jgi:hypothetical protein
MKVSLRRVKLGHFPRLLADHHQPERGAKSFCS